MPKIILLLFVCLLLQSCSSKEQEKTKASLRSISESVYASVTIVPEDLYNVYAQSPGLLERVYIKEGDLVKKGQALAQIDNNSQRISVESAKLNVDFANQNKQKNAAILAGLAEEIKSVDDQIKLDSINYLRQKNLWDKGIGSKSELDNRQLKFELLQNNRKALRKKYQQTKLELDNNYQQSQYSLQKVQSTLDDFIIKAKMDGKVYDLRKEEGELISLQEPLAQIGKENAFLIEMLIDEVDIAKVSPGQLIYITLDAYKDQVFEASLIKIYPLKDTRTQTFQVEGRFNKEPPTLFAGLSGEANIVLTEKKNAMTIPLNYLMQGKKVKTEQGEILVETGISNMSFVEILSGIDTSTVLLKPEQQ
jgi:HlyD family secretion protein